MGDPSHLMIPAMLHQCAENFFDATCTRKSMSHFDVNPPIPIRWDSVVRRTIDRRTGVVMVEDTLCSLEQQQMRRPFQGETPKEVFAVFFSWQENPAFPTINRMEVPNSIDKYHSITNELIELCSSNSRLLPRSTYRKVLGDGVRTITYGDHTSNAAREREIGRTCKQHDRIRGTPNDSDSLSSIGHDSATKISIFFNHGCLADRQ